MAQRAGTLHYVAPEVLRDSYNEKCDVWTGFVLVTRVPSINERARRVKALAAHVHHVLLLAKECRHRSFPGMHRLEALAADAEEETSQLVLESQPHFKFSDWQVVPVALQELVRDMLTSDTKQRLG
eukprot:CAMPEP_0204179882 /NCGR_PEP_ID=MMETSP0361-20130328/50541_1 /ASSEMBLY_ACC=CAM_ASM_000343 /TAXON_ID=268821 /ORGANISM="Scrippsiella Hangoei, Strain SHTV-5" /LENGTH=125 /DNA_ID=CAMNT_0051139211 /DNA_START=22 /DNA_END=397 /DNA_ORIENTATION=+